MNTGTVVSVRGGVVAARFLDRLPELYSALRVDRPDEDLLIEVLEQTSPEVVEGIALASTAGLRRGARVIDRGSPLTAGPLGSRTPDASGPSGSMRNSG